MLTAVGIAAYGAAPLLGRPELAGPALSCGLLLALLCALHGALASTRQAMTDRLSEAVASELGLRTPDRRSVSAQSWTFAWPGAPRRVDLRYAPGIDDTDPQWRSDLVATVGRRMLARYEITSHDRRRCRLRLQLVPDRDDAPVPAVQQRAERTIAELLGPTAKITGVDWAGAELLGIDVRHEAGAKLAAAPYRHRVERVVSTMLPGRWRARWDLEGDLVRFEVRPTLPQLVEHPAPVITAQNRDLLPMAVSEDGEVVSWNLRGTGPHAIVVGRTGTGKTVVINGLVMEACARAWPVWICDPKRVEFMGMRGWPNLQLVATTVQEQVAVIYRAWEEMESRYALVESGQADERDFQPLILVLDEYRDFVGVATDWYAQAKVRGMPARCPVFEKVSSLARKGRTARVHLILGTQRPDAEWLGGEMRDNFATRISLGRLSPQGAMMMWEVAYAGVSIPRGIPGRGTAVDDADRPLEVQSYWTPDPRRATPADQKILERLRPNKAIHPPLQVQLGEVDESESASAEWVSVLTAELVPATDIPLPAPPTTDPAATTGSGSAAEPGAHLDDKPAVEPGDDGYGPEENIRVGAVREGDLVLVDDDTSTWGVVELAEPDLDDEELICLDWRGDADDFGSLSLSVDVVLTTRRPSTFDGGGVTNA